MPAVHENQACIRFYRRIAMQLNPEFERALTGRALDLSCGSGLSTSVWTQASPRLAWTGVVERLGDELLFQTGEFSAIGSSFAYPWLSEGILKEAHRVLQPGGILALAVPLAATGSTRSGNRLLLRWLWATRKLLRSSHPHLRLNKIENALHGWRIERMESVTLVERFESNSLLWETLISRGTIAAILGDSTAIPPSFEEGEGPVDFEWRIGLIAARKPV